MPDTGGERHAAWNLDELTLALDLYFRRGLVSQASDEVLELSRVLHQMSGRDADDGPYRTPNSVHMKLANFRARERPGSGLPHGNRLETELWDRFLDHRDLLTAEAQAIRAGLGRAAAAGRVPTSFGLLQPFKAKADLDYVVHVQGGPRHATRRHETLVNDFAAWLVERGLEPMRNVAIDLGTNDPAVIVEAEEVVSWARSIREAVGQLYEYRYFQVARPDAALVFLASRPVPEKWLPYLEEDRGIGVAWRDRNGFVLSERALAAFDLPGR